MKYPKNIFQDFLMELIINIILKILIYFSTKSLADLQRTSMTNMTNINQPILANLANNGSNSAALKQARALQKNNKRQAVLASTAEQVYQSETLKKLHEEQVQITSSK